MCGQVFCIVLNKGLKLRGHRKGPNFLVEGTSTSYHFSSLYTSIEMLPETVGNKLPETMDDAINIGKNSNRGICTCICPQSLDEMFKEN